LAIIQSTQLSQQANISVVVKLHHSITVTASTLLMHATHHIQYRTHHNMAQSSTILCLFIKRHLQSA